jgi:signal transduction histidine kinase
MCVAWLFMNALVMNMRGRLVGRAGAAAGTRPGVAWPGTAAGAGLALALTAILAADTAWTAAYRSGWPFELVAGAAVCALALSRSRDRAGAPTQGRYRAQAAAWGLVVCGAAAIVADVASLPSQPGPAAMAGLLVLAAACTRTAAARPAVLVAVAGAAVMALGRVVNLRPAYAVGSVFLGLLLWAGALAAGLWLRWLDARRRMAIDAARRDERLDLARELHDVVAHHIAGMVVQAQAAQLVTGREPGLAAAGTLAGSLAGIESAGTEAMAAMRQVVGLLRGPGDAAGLRPGPEQLSELVTRFTGHGPAVDLELPDGDQPAWPPEVTSTVYRVVQEALTNVVRHAQGAERVTVTVSADPGVARVEVTDDAPPGLGATGPGGYGLAGMRERVEALAGTLAAGPRPGGGWMVRASLPLAPRWLS